MERRFEVGGCPLADDALPRGIACVHCTTCDKTVHDLSAMPPAETEAVLARVGTERVCVQAWVDRRGRIVRPAIAALGLVTAQAALADGAVPVPDPVVLEQLPDDGQTPTDAGDPTATDTHDAGPTPTTDPNVTVFDLGDLDLDDLGVMPLRGQITR